MPDAHKKTPVKNLQGYEASPNLRLLHGAGCLPVNSVGVTKPASASLIT